MDGGKRKRPSRSAKTSPCLLPKGWSGTASYRCSPHLIPQIAELLSEQQKGFVRKIGFGSLLSMADFEINKALTMWLVGRFSCDTEALEFEGGASIPVRPLVKCVLGIPSGPIKVVQGLDVDEALYNKYSCTKVKKAKEVAEEMCSITEEEPFCIAFMMVILAIYLAPNTTMLVNRSLLGAAQQVGRLKRMDWCGFVADYLFKGIREFKESDAPFVLLKGCVHILSVVFIDHVKHAAFQVPNGFPRLGVVTTEHNKWVASHPFGSLLVRRLEESVYAPVLNNGNGNIVEGGKCADSDTNTDALANLPATDNDQNNQHPVSAGPGSLSTDAALETSAQSAGTNHLHGAMGSNPAAHANPSSNGKRGSPLDGGSPPSRSARKPRKSGSAVYRCSPRLIPSIMELLSEEQKGFVRKIGFGSLLSMADFEMNKALTLWLVDKFNCDTKALEFGGGVSIPVRPLVKSVLGIPSGPIQVVQGLHVDDAVYSQYCSVKGKLARKLAEEMRSITEEEPFCIAFMMTILAIYLAPNTTVLVNRSLLGAAQQVGNLKQMDWCDFVADYLFKGIREFKESDAPFVCLKGCVHILSVIYIDHVKHAAFQVPNGFPRLGVVTTEHNKWVASHPFGSLLVHHLEESVYAPVLNNGNGNIVEGGECADSDTNTDALANLPATDNDRNNQHPVSAGPGSLSIFAALETSAQSAGTNHLHGAVGSNPAAHANPSSNGKRGSAMDGGSSPSRSAKRHRPSKSAAYRCSPRLIPPIMELLSEEQKGFLRKIGFGSLLSMADFEMNKALTLWLVHKFSCDTKALEFGGGVSIPVRPLVKSVLGIPSGPIKVVQGLPIKGKNALYSQYCSVKGKNARKLAEEMCSITEEEPFCIAFMMVILAIYLAPNTTVLVNKSFLGAAQQVGSLKQMDWCGFVADYLFKGIREFKNSGAPFVCLKGCVHILSVIFIDLVKHAAFEVPNGFPRLGVVTTKHNKWVASHPFGSLLVRRLEESVYAPVLNNGNVNIVEGGECADSDTNTDALSNQSATDNDQNNQHPVSAGPGSLPIVTGLETSARSAEHIIFPRSGEQLQSAGPSSEPYSAQIPNGLEVLAAAAESRNRGSPSTMEKHDRSAKKARVELPESEQVVRAGEATIRMDMSLFSCRVCSHPVKPPVFQCNVGHLACGGCLAELPDEQCQMCEHGGDFSRCPVMDDVVLSSTMKCSYDGCQIYVPYHELSDHQSTCPHRPCFCTETGCSFIGTPAALLGHLAALHSVPVHKVHYGSVHQLRVSEPRFLLHGEEDDSAFLLALGVLGMATVVSVVCIRAGASPEPRYAVKLWANGPPPPSSAAGSILLDMTAATSSSRPGKVAVEELPSFLMVPPAYLVDCGAYKEVSLDVRIDRM